MSRRKARRGSGEGFRYRGFMAVKVQRALIPADGPALVYNHDKTFYAQMPIFPALEQALGEDLKGYFRARFNTTTKQLEIHQRLPDQPW